jgi:hypothetical protein
VRGVLEFDQRATVVQLPVAPTRDRGEQHGVEHPFALARRQVQPLGIDDPPIGHQRVVPELCDHMLSGLERGSEERVSFGDPSPTLLDPYSPEAAPLRT